jgi:hypothetical protein
MAAGRSEFIEYYVESWYANRDPRASALRGSNEAAHRCDSSCHLRNSAETNANFRRQVFPSPSDHTPRDPDTTLPAKRIAEIYRKAGSITTTSVPRATGAGFRTSKSKYTPAVSGLPSPSTRRRFPGFQVYVHAGGFRASKSKYTPDSHDSGDNAYEEATRATVASRLARTSGVTDLVQKGPKALVDVDNMGYDVNRAAVISMLP